MKQLLDEIFNCTVCKNHLPHGVNPCLAAKPSSKIIIIGQAPGKIVHETNIPFNDKSGDNLRSWLGVDKESFYDTSKFAIIPMGFCYPGAGKSGDLPPRKECAPLWHSRLFNEIHEAKLILLIGKYAQEYYLPETKKLNLTNRVKNFEDYLPQYLVLPHPSPRNNIWQAKNKWFPDEVLPILKALVKDILH